MAREADQNNSSRKPGKLEMPKGTPVNAHKLMAAGETLKQADHPSLMTEHVEPKPR